VKQNWKKRWWYDVKNAKEILKETVRTRVKFCLSCKRSCLVASATAPPSWVWLAFLGTTKKAVKGEQHSFLSRKDITQANLRKS